MIFLYFIIIFYLNLDNKNFIKTLLVVTILALPGIIFVLFWPKILKATFEFKFYNSLLVNSSIISFYLIPFFSIIFYFKKKIKLIDKDKLAIFLIAVFLIICSYFFDYNYLMGGGYFIKLSKILLGNFYFFYLTSIIGFFLLYLLSKENVLNLILNLIIITAISAYIIFMKYFEPMFIIILFLLFKTKLTNIFLENKKYILYYNFYFLVYLCSAIANNYFLFSKNI